MIETVTEAAEVLAGVQVTIGAGIVLLVLVVAMYLPEPWKFMYSRAAFQRMRADRDEWKARWESDRAR